MVSTTIETAFTATEQTESTPLAQLHRARLAKKLDDGTLVWNLRRFWLFFLLGTWTGFESCENMLLASRTKTALEDPDTIWRLLARCFPEESIIFSFMPIYCKDK